MWGPELKLQYHQKNKTKQIHIFWAGVVAQVIEQLPSKYKTLNSNTSTANKKKKKFFSIQLLVSNKLSPSKMLKVSKSPAGFNNWGNSGGEEDWFFWLSLVFFFFVVLGTEPRASYNLLNQAPSWGPGFKNS
jgi:hypothetical protein